MGIKLVGSPGPQISFTNKLGIDCVVIWDRPWGQAVWSWKVLEEVLCHIQDHLWDPLRAPGMHHRQAVLDLRKLYGTEQYSPPFLQYSPLLIDGKGEGAETPLFPSFFVCLLQVRCHKKHLFMSPCVWSWDVRQAVGVMQKWHLSCAILSSLKITL